MTLTYDHKILTWKYQLDRKFTNLTSLMDRKFFLPFVALLINFLLGKMFNIFYAYAMNAKKLKMLVNMKKICIWKRCMLCSEEERGITYREWDPCVVSTICIVADTGSSG